MMNGKWPSLGARFVSDLLPASRAPGNDGVEQPDLEDPEWIWTITDLPGVVDVARRSHQDARDRASSAEAKSARLVQLSLTLLTISLALSGFYFDLLLSAAAWPWFLTLLPAALAVIFLSIAALEAHQVDRVGLYQVVEAQDLVGVDEADLSGTLLALEERGRQLASWTADKKHSDVMQARAWFTRGLVALVIAALVLIAARATIPEQEDSAGSDTESTQSSTEDAVGGP